MNRMFAGRPVGYCGALAAVVALVLAGCGIDANGAAPPPCGGKKDLHAEGSLTQQGAMAVFKDAWAQVCPGKTLYYIPTGSADGRKKFIGMESDFAGSDSVLAPDQVAPAAQRCGGNPALNLPMVFTAIGVVYHLEGVPKLVVSGRLLGEIFSGKITTWNDPAVAALNPGVALPAIPVTPVYRNDMAGITNDFQKVLAESAGDAWLAGSGSDFRGGVGVGVEATVGAVTAVKATPGAIGYVDAGTAQQASLPMAHLDSGYGAVEPTAKTAAVAIDGAEFVDSTDNLALNLGSVYRTREPGGYPLIQVTYEIVCSRSSDADTAVALRSFLHVAAGTGQLRLADAGYIPLPEEMRFRILEVIDAIQ